jgi:hypothetical protein
MDVVIDNENIGDILPSGSRRFEDVQVIDLKGAVLSPGFVDCHQHYLCDELPPPDRQMNDQTAGGVTLSNADAFVSFRGAEKARKTLYAGFTTAIDAGGANYIEVALKDAINMGYIEGPHVYCRQAAHRLAVSFPGEWAPRLMVPTACAILSDNSCIGGWIRSRSKLRPPSARSAGAWQIGLTAEEVSACCDEAHSAGLLVSAHARSPNSIMVFPAERRRPDRPRHRYRRRMHRIDDQSRTSTCFRLSPLRTESRPSGTRSAAAEAGRAAPRTGPHTLGEHRQGIQGGRVKIALVHRRGQNVQ